jgi:hypothetical protein
LVTVLLVDLIVETVHEGDVAGLVVTPQEDQAIRILEFVEEQEGDCLN